MKLFWDWISNIGVDDTMEFETSRRIVLLNRVSIVMFCIIFSTRIILSLLGVSDVNTHVFLPFVAIFSILTIPYFNKLGYYRFVSVFVSVATPIFALIFSVWTQSFNEMVSINHYYVPRMLLMALTVLPLVLIDPRRKLIMAVALIVNIVCVFSFDYLVRLIGVPFNPATIDFSHYSLISRMMLLPFGLIVAGFLFMVNLNRKYESLINDLNKNLINKNVNFGFYTEEITAQRDIIAAKNRQLEQSNEEVTAQRDTIVRKNAELESVREEIEEINKDLTDSILYAKNIQQAVLFKQQLPPSFFRDSFVFLKAKSHVSGDFYYYKTIECNNKHSLVVAAVDCTGHGVPGGFMSMLGMTLINEILHNEPISNAADILNLLRDRIKTTLNQTGKLTEQKDGMDMSICIYYPESKILEFAGARNPLLIIGSDTRIQLIKGNRQPVGIYVNETEFTNHTIKLLGGEMLYLFSDGMQDQFGGSKGKKLKMKNLQNILSDISHMPCDIQKRTISEFLDQWVNPDPQNRYEQVDDIVLIGMRV